MIAISKGEITGDANIEMKYANYQTAIVEKYHVVLDNWPVNGYNYENMNLTTLSTILSALTTGKCAWRKLTPGEIAERDARNWNQTRALTPPELASQGELVSFTLADRTNRTSISVPASALQLGLSETTNIGERNEINGERVPVGVDELPPLKKVRRERSDKGTKRGPREKAASESESAPTPLPITSFLPTPTPSLSPAIVPMVIPLSLRQWDTIHRPYQPGA